MSLILCKQGQFRFKGFRLIIRKLNLFIKRRYFKVQYPSYKRNNSYWYKLYVLSIHTKWSCLRQFLSNFVHQCRLKDVNFNNWCNLDFIKKTNNNSTNHLISFSYSKHFKMVPGIQRSNGL